MLLAVAVIVSSAPPLLIHSETLSTFCYESPLCQAKSCHGIVKPLETMFSKVIRRIDSCLTGFFQLSQRDVAVGGQLSAIGSGQSSNQSFSRTDGSRITRNQTLEQKNEELDIFHEILSQC